MLDDRSQLKRSIYRLILRVFILRLKTPGKSRFYNALGCDTLLKRVSGQYTVLQRVKIQSAPTGNRARAHRVAVRFLPLNQRYVYRSEAVPEPYHYISPAPVFS